MFESVKDLSEAVKAAATIEGDRITVSGASALAPEVVDRLAWTAAFGASPEIKGTARWVIRSVAAAAGIRPASIHDLYIAMGQGKTGGFTVPAINVRAMGYETARAVIRAAKKLNAGAFIFEIARSEIGYTEQRPHEYAAILFAAALREGFTGPLFIQGDHVQTNAKKYNSPERDKELETLRGLIREEIAAGFYNIDIDTSTLVDLDKPTLEEQQAVNCDLAADFAAFIRRNEPKDVTVSVGGEIGEVGGKNSDVHELHAYMQGFNAALKRTIDFALSCGALIVLAIPLGIVAALVKLTSNGPVFYRQERMGLDGKSFTIVKFRSMFDDAEKHTGPVWAVQGDPRVTPLGRFMRKSNVDELPQLWNVLMGDMSIVGPRPERPHFVEQFKHKIPQYMLRHKVKAGITGWAQVNGWRGNTSIEQRIQYDLYYIENWSLLLDLKILALTLVRGFVHKNAY